MSIDLGNNPVGSTPTDAQKTQLRSSIGLGSTDTVEFGELATSQLNFPNPVSYTHLTLPTKA